jgi:phosphoenolpyruvate synthase/pyruvate phosphate dikinase
MPLVVNLADVSDSDLPLVGGKASKLGEVVRQGLPVPPGIVVTTEAYQTFVDQTTVGKVLEEALAALDLSKGEAVDAASRKIREAFETTPFPAELKQAIVSAFERFAKDEEIRFVAVRSSATAEDLEGASFAGLQ